MQQCLCLEHPLTLTTTIVTPYAFTSALIMLSHNDRGVEALIVNM